MRLVLAITLGLVLQVILYALGSKPFDAFLAFITVLLLAGTYEVMMRYLARGKD